VWGKWVQNQIQTTLITSEKKFYELLTSPCTEVTNFILPNNDVAWVSWKYNEENVSTGKYVKVAVAA
jgi:DNA replication initiation complex subunit (GINS family)